jgi:uncharacterized protein (TIGR03437 family)
VAPNQPGRIVVQPDFTHLAAGTYTGSLQLTFPGGVTRTVNILSIVSGGATNSFSDDLPLSTEVRRSEFTPRASGCSPQKLILQLMAPDKNVVATTSQVAKIQAAAADDCGNPLNTGLVTARFNNGDPDQAMSATGGGHWEGSWSPNKSSTQVQMVITALHPISATQVIGGQTPVLTFNMVTGKTPQPNPQVQNSASLVSQALVAPGGLISIFGTDLADTCDTRPTPPLAGQLGGTQVLLDNRPLAISYACNTQINAQVPFDVPVNSAHQVLVQRTASLSVPVQISVASTQPAIFTVNQQGTGQGSIFGTLPDGSLSGAPADPATPAKAGDTVSIFCTGLGTVAPSVDLGAPAPTAPVAQAISPVLVTIGGQTATVLSAALTPNRAGVYTVTVVVPQGVTPGDQVPVVLTSVGQTSPPVTMAIR